MKSQIACLVLCSGFVFAQTPAIESPAAQKPIVVRWSLSDPRCTVVYLNGIGHEQFSDGARSIGVYTPIERDKNTYQVLVGVGNLRREALDVDPANMGGLSDDAPQMVMESIDADAKIAKENHSHHGWAILGAALAGGAAGAGSNKTATVNNSDGSTSTVTYHDDTATRQAARNAANNRVAIDARSAKESSHLLRRNTVLHGEEVFGFIYIQKPKGMSKKAHVGSFVVDLGDTIYVFPFANGAIPK
jgi:hypothetical protein